MNETNAGLCYAFCSLFESELLLRLMMENWQHPFAEDDSFRNALLESATELLATAADESCSEIFIEGLPASEMNFVAAVWYCEWNGVQDDREQHEARQKWLAAVRSAIPSCFCSTEFLD